MERWTPDNIENEPYVELHIPNEEVFLATRQTARLYTHLGKLALYDHVYCNDNERSFYVFSFVNGFEELAQHMAENQYPLYLNQTEISDTDIEAYDRAIASIASKVEHVPDEWLE